MNNMLNFEKTILERHALDVLGKEEALILSVFKKKKDFISIEESKHLISINKIINNGVFIKTEYLFKGKLVLIVYAPKYEFINCTFTSTVEYEEIF